MAEIEVRNLSKVFLSRNGNVNALKGINLSIEKGNIYGIIGMSGAGKSTLVRCLNYLEQPTDGTVTVRGSTLGSLDKRKLRKKQQEIAMIFQHFNLLMQKSVLENVCFPLYIQGQKKRKARERALELLQVVGLEDKKNAYPAQLSGGQKQRVAIARALASNPKILLCDEATSALDPQTTASILELLREINQKYGITIMIITHQMAVVREICSHVAILKDGEVVEDGLVSQVFANPQTGVARDLIRKDTGSEVSPANPALLNEIEQDERVRIVFSENSAFQPVIANMVLKFGSPVNILRADTKNVGGIAKGEMILGLPKQSLFREEMKAYLKECGLSIQEVSEDVE